MSMEIEIGRITAFDNANGQGVLARVDFKDYDITNEHISVDVILPLNKDDSLKKIEALALEKAKQQLRDLVASF